MAAHNNVYHSEGTALLALATFFLDAENPKGDRPLPEPLEGAMGGSANSYLPLTLAYTLTALPAAVFPHQVNYLNQVEQKYYSHSLGSGCQLHFDLHKHM